MCQCLHTKDPLVTLLIQVDRIVSLIQYCNGILWMRCYLKCKRGVTGWYMCLAMKLRIPRGNRLYILFRFSRPITSRRSAWCSDIALVLIIRFSFIFEIFGVWMLFPDPTVFCLWNPLVILSHTGDLSIDSVRTVENSWFVAIGAENCFMVSAWKSPYRILIILGTNERFYHSSNREGVERSEWMADFIVFISMFSVEMFDNDDREP